MKKPVIISIVGGIILFFGIAYILIDKIAEQRARVEIVRMREEQQLKEEIEKARQQKEQLRQEEIRKAQKQLKRYRNILDEIKVKLQVAEDNLQDIRGFHFLRTQDEKEEQLKDQYYKIQELEKLQDSAKTKIAQQVERITELQNNKEQINNEYAADIKE